MNRARFALVLIVSLIAAAPVEAQAPSPLRLEVGAAQVDGRVYPPHRARNRVYPPNATTPVTSWTNELTIADSAGVRVMRWVTLGTQPNGVTWDLRQTYDARTLAPIAYSYRNSAGVEKMFTVNGTHVTGHIRTPNDSVARPIDWTLPRLGFMASASDLVPPAVGLREGAVIHVPVWSADSTAPVQHYFRVLPQRTVEVEGEMVLAWPVEERVEETDHLEATWYLVDRSPYMVLAEIPTPNGIRRITGVAE
jgi:hypothetical protein